MNEVPLALSSSPVAYEEDWKVISKQLLSSSGLMSQRQRAESKLLSLCDPELSFLPGCGWLLPSFALFHHGDKCSQEAGFAGLVYCCSNIWQVLCSCLLSSCPLASFSSEKAWTVTPSPTPTADRGDVSLLGPWLPAVIPSLPNATLLFSGHNLSFGVRLNQGFHLSSWYLTNFFTHSLFSIKPA